ncbi:DUF6786 family protein [Flavobacterium algicola]|uniref:DUF6786 family protein n=1 Tax=Flavobacterium algicola TaxID=556529 RepID=UPI001EFE3DDB|nr:DUF6786 family protein [Flavobacterium algicola]MCG9792847.1 hypothetical protein [Flavobacterium algicola]
MDRRKLFLYSLNLFIMLLVVGCSKEETGQFASDLSFLKQHTDIIVLKNGKSAIALAPDYQGRVMTSTFDDASGPSFGWINRPVIEKGILPSEATKGKLEEHIYIFGGEERFWLGPEGGQYSLYFKPGDKFEFSDWKTPAVIDTEAFKVVEKTTDKAVFHRDCELMNYSGTVFKMGINRTVRLLNDKEVSQVLNLSIPKSVQFVAFESDNKLTNNGQNAWKSETGLPSIWLLGMLSPSPNTTVVIPFKSGEDSQLGQKVNDAYFGKVPTEYIKVEDDILFFKGDGTRRGKIGVNALRSKGVSGSYDADGKVLTVVTYNVQAAPNGFVNSMWEFQKEPYSGDVINSYNDGSPAPGEAPLGPFYELETSSPAAALKPGETMTHIQKTMHFYGSEADLDIISKKMFGVGIEKIKQGFK